MTVETPAPAPRVFLVPALAGLLPFIAGAALVWLLDGAVAVLAFVLLLQYAAIVVACLGAVHWGLAMAGYGGVAGPGRIALGVAPALLAWLALQLPPLPAVVALCLLLAGLGVADRAAATRGLVPAWYPRLRRPLTAVAIFCLGIALFGQARLPG